MTKLDTLEVQRSTTRGKSQAQRTDVGLLCDLRRYLTPDFARVDCGAYAR